MTACAREGCACPRGTAQCHCGGCHHTFSGVSAFDKHQTVPEGGGITCHWPGSRGLVQRAAGGLEVWGRPGPDGDPWAALRRDAAVRTANPA